ncbi:MAG: hydroxymethylbilane synthase [Candidatus Obscuribacterales bacterium]|nr:hydroxymethylbilane synthase [Steroidobacteraceae bacterium]
MSTLLRIATRQSKLALWQAEHVAALLRAAHPALQIELVKLTTQGDRILDRPLADIGGKGLFIKELEVALAENRADLAVHSMKDVPSEVPAGMVLAAMLLRADARDAFVSQKYASLASLPQGARIGTSSLRRQSQLLHTRSDIEIVQLRGNVDTRLRKLDAGEYDAIILASAGLIRLGWGNRITQFLPIEQSLPAVGQGIIGIECRSDDTATLNLVSVLNDHSAQTCIAAERAFAERLEGSCQSPIAGYAELKDGAVKLQGLVASIDGQRVFRDTVIGAPKDAAQLGRALANRLLYTGADELLRELRNQK